MKLSEKAHRRRQRRIQAFDNNASVSKRHPVSGHTVHRPGSFKKNHPKGTGKR